MFRRKRLLLAGIGLVSLMALAGCRPAPAAPPGAEGESASRPLGADRLEALWADLADSDAKKAYSALCLLTDHPAESVPFLREHLRPAEPADPKRVALLIAALDDDRFDTRKKAKEELKSLNTLAKPAVRKALGGAPSEEARQALQQILGESEGPVTAPEMLRGVRAVEVLERVGDADAKRVLQALAQGAPEARLTREAKASLTRLHGVADRALKRGMNQGTEGDEHI